MPPERETVVEWTDKTGTVWRVERRYDRSRQQWECSIASKIRDTWRVRERMVLDGKEAFEGKIPL
ncbi:hypothetical protein [Halocatena marina]|uniref:hypothetical protein n=1 Tax=Halocatena marina TaxID=2934937 RepID=UPI00200DEAB4|nr:hypothetical protein [Halocatena marina]